MDERGMPDPQGAPIPPDGGVPARYPPATGQAQTYPGPGFIPAAGHLRNTVLTIISVPLAAVVLIAIVAAASGGGSNNPSTGQFNGGLGSGLPQQYSSSTTTDPYGNNSASEPQVQSNLSTSDEFGQIPSDNVSDTPTDDPFGTDSSSDTPTDGSFGTDAGSSTDSATPTDTGSSTDTASATATITPTATDPASVVMAYFQAINAKDYQTAWNLGGKNLDGQSLAHFSAGFSTTQTDAPSILGVTGDVVSVNFTAIQTDDSTKSFSGTYTVVDGVITTASITQTS